jgi:hypothetical protein
LKKFVAIGVRKVRVTYIHTNRRSVRNNFELQIIFPKIEI